MRASPGVAGQRQLGNNAAEMVTFSHRTPSEQRRNRYAAARERIGECEFDLTESNPTRCGFAGAENALAALADPAGRRYEPDPLGLPSARRAVAGEYRRWGAPVDPEQIFLTASTSEAYGFIFKLLADPGDHVLIPSPSYPLFGQLARLDAVIPTAYTLDAEASWRIERSLIDHAPRSCRAVVAVHPNNPTGSYIHPDDASFLTETCRARGWALVVDEVFLPYVLDPNRSLPASFARNDRCLTFTLGGASKSIGMPQLKLAWIVVSGPDDLVTDAARRLEYIADAYLSVSTPVARAAPELLARGRASRTAIRDRCRENLRTLMASVATCPAVSLSAPEGGWSAVIRTPAVVDDEELAIRLLEDLGVAVHPGYLFDLPSDSHLVLSLLPPADVFAEGVRRIMAFVAGRITS